MGFPLSTIPTLIRMVTPFIQVKFHRRMHNILVGRQMEEKYIRKQEEVVVPSRGPVAAPDY